MKAISWIKLALTALLIAAFTLAALNGVSAGSFAMAPIAESISLGLDLRGGVSTEYIAVDPPAENLDTLMDGTVSALRTRLTNAGYTEATVARQGEHKIRVEIPDVTDPEQVMSIIGKPAHLEFIDPDGNAVMDGSDVKEASVIYDDKNMPQVGLELTGEGAKVFAQVTAANVGRQIYIVLDDEVISAPVVQEPISGGRVSISINNGTREEIFRQAKDLSLLIMSGALPLDIEEGETRTISATLGVKAIDNALIAGMVGLALVALFMIVMYRLPGVMACMALSVYMLIVFYALALVPGVQLTLQGIAGILLGIGMAVDANVIIFERFREELKGGRDLKNAVRMGFKNALSAVMDSNITTIIAACALLYFGTGSIKGFAITLLIGVVASLMTAIFVTRFLMKALVGTGIRCRACWTR